MENEEGDFCWVRTQDSVQRRQLQLGDSNDVFIVVEAGVLEGDEVVLNPTAYLEDAQIAAMRAPAISEPDQQDAPPLQGSSSP